MKINLPFSHKVSALHYSVLGHQDLETGVMGPSVSDSEGSTGNPDGVSRTGVPGGFRY